MNESASEPSGGPIECVKAGRHHVHRGARAGNGFRVVTAFPDPNHHRDTSNTIPATCTPNTVDMPVSGNS